MGVPATSPCYAPPAPNIPGDIPGRPRRSLEIPGDPRIFPSFLVGRARSTPPAALSKRCGFGYNPGAGIGAEDGAPDFIA